MKKKKKNNKNETSSGICGLTQCPRYELEPILEEMLKRYGYLVVQVVRW